MEPIVHGLSEEYAGRLVVERRNAAEEVAKAGMALYQLRGHPSFVLAAPDGNALWTWTGPIAELGLHTAVQSALDE
jgi:hypothetical protein